jgi:hypothetical protein
MAEHHTGPVETGAPMDYREHENTYKLFLNASKYGALIIVSLLIAMASGFFGHAGLLGGLLIFIVVCLIGAVILR